MQAVSLRRERIRMTSICAHARRSLLIWATTTMTLQRYPEAVVPPEHWTLQARVDHNATNRRKTGRHDVWMPVFERFRLG